MSTKTKVRCKHCNSTNHVSNDCPVKGRQLFKALTADPKARQVQEAEAKANMLLSAEDEVQDFLKEMKQAKENKESLKALMAEEVKKNEDRAYDEMRDVGELMADYKQAGNDVTSMALVKYQGGQLALREDQDSGEELEPG